MNKFKKQHTLGEFIMETLFFLKQKTFGSFSILTGEAK